MFILQCQKVKKMCQILIKSAKAYVVLLVYQGVLYHVIAYLVAVSYHSLYTNKTPDRFYQDHDYFTLKFIWPLKITQLKDKMIFVYFNCMRYIFKVEVTLHQVNSTCLSFTCKYKYKGSVMQFCRIWEKCFTMQRRVCIWIESANFIQFINVWENPRGNQEWTTQRHWQYWARTRFRTKKNKTKKNKKQKTKQNLTHTPQHR